ncbi:MAG: hypothetical protein KDC80_07545, partial [Saprospiraceae bacterium]|nr:hypothetical protein [Saprospiraceae bacterium]
MRVQLQKFSSFASQLLPHETSYLLAVQKFTDSDRLNILELVNQNSHQIGEFTPFDTEIDKRKYSHLQNWIGHTLNIVDVDIHFEWMNKMEQKIVTDTIDLEEEKELLSRINNYSHPEFYFKKFYELIIQYRQFLLIRIRYSDYETVNSFLEEFAHDYIQAKDIYEKLHTATKDIVGQYSGAVTESIHWEDWLNEVFYDENVDGLNRYLALVRLIFISFNYARFDILKDKFEYLDHQFSRGIFYSKRLLLNYYNNRLLFHAHYKEYEKALYYGYLSVRSKNHDYLHYVNNLCAVLLRLEHNEEALELMKRASVDLKHTGNMHSKIGFASFYIEAMNKTKLYKHAENYGDSFLQLFSKEILQYRWHLFYSVYFLALLNREKFEKILDTSKKMRLLEKDKSHQVKAKYLPTIPLYILISNFKTGLLSRKLLLERLNQYCVEYAPDHPNHSGFTNVLHSLQPIA